VSVGFFTVYLLLKFLIKVVVFTDSYSTTVFLKNQRNVTLDSDG